MDLALRIFLATLVFALSAYFAARLRLSLSKKGEDRYVDPGQYYSIQLGTARTYINGLLFKMFWGWIACALILSLVPKEISVVILGCLFLGIILSAVSYDKVRSFKPVELDSDEINREAADQLISQLGYLSEENKEAYEREWQGALRASQEKATREALEKANRPMRRSNEIIIMAVVLASFMIPVLAFMAKWAGSISTSGFIILIVVMAVVNLIAYFMAILFTD